MNLFDFLGYVFPLLVVLFLIYKKNQENKKRPEEKSWEMERKKEEKHPTPSYLHEKQVRLQKPQDFNTKVDDRFKENRLDLSLAPKYELYRFKESSRVEKLMKKLPSKKEMFIIQAIIGQPKGME